MAFTTTLRVRFGHEDHAQIVYYPRFFHFFHCAFEDFFDQQGFPYRACLDDDRIGWPAVHAEADFVKPVRFGTDLQMKLDVTRLGDKSATFAYEGSVERELVCRGKITVVCISMDNFRSRCIPDKYRAVFERHLVGNEAGSTPSNVP